MVARPISGVQAAELAGSALLGVSLFVGLCRFKGLPKEGAVLLGLVPPAGAMADLIYHAIRSQSVEDEPQAELAQALQESNAKVAQLGAELEQLRTWPQQARDRLTQIRGSLQGRIEEKEQQERLDAVIVEIDRLVMLEHTLNPAELEPLQAMVTTLLIAIEPQVEPNSYLWDKFKVAWAGLSDELTAKASYCAVEKVPQQDSDPFVVVQLGEHSFELTVSDVLNKDLGYILEWDLTQLQDPAYCKLNQLAETRYKKMRETLFPMEDVDIEQPSCINASTLKTDLGKVEFFTADGGVFGSCSTVIQRNDMRTLTAERFIEWYRAVVEYDNELSLVV